MIEREFGPEACQGYEEYVQQFFNLKNGTVEIEPLASNIEFPNGVDFMNQVFSYERLEYFGYIYEEAGLLANTQLSPNEKRKPKPKVAFGQRAVSHEEIAKLEGALKQNYKISPYKIRKAGAEELESLIEQNKNRSLDSR